MLPSLRLKPNAAARVLNGHPWVFANEVVELLPSEQDGEVVECRDRQGRFLGSGIYNSRSQIVWRRFSRDHATLDGNFIKGALERAISRRASSDVRRLVWSESDDLPGLIVDQFADVLVVQTQTLAMERRLAVVVELLGELLKPSEILLRNDATIRRLEGLPFEVRTASGKPLAPRWQNIGGIDYWLDFEGGQKTGFYVDQLGQYGRVSAGAAGKRVLDCFCNQGGFALHCAKAGAREVLGLDSSEDAISAARKNAERNGVAATTSFRCENVFDFLAARTPETWDIVVLDPPPFARSKSALGGALRGYKEINLRAMKRLVPGGLLATYTCSHHVGASEFLSILGEAAADARRSVRVVEFAHQPADHPVLVTMPESEYLRGFLLRID